MCLKKACEKCSLVIDKNKIIGPMVQMTWCYLNTKKFNAARLYFVKCHQEFPNSEQESLEVYVVFGVSGEVLRGFQVEEWPALFFKNKKKKITSHLKIVMKAAPTDD